MCANLAGLLACWWSFDALLALAPADLPRAGQVALDLRVLGVAACPLLTGLGVGLTPALRLACVAPTTMPAAVPS